MICYVIVLDVSDNGKPYYYRGFFNPRNFLPSNTNEFDFAMKCSDKISTDMICNEINLMEKNPFKYHVEEHIY